MKWNKKMFFRIHSWIGVKLSILFFIVCLSGTFATISHELDWLFNPVIRASPTDTYASKNAIVAAIQRQYPHGKIQFWNTPPEPYLCDIVYIKDRDQRRYVFANPYTGCIQGSATLTIQRFFRDLHYFLFIPLQVGHFTVLVFAFMLFISMATALFFYKRWYIKLFELRTGKGAVVLFRSFHRLVGVWSVPFTILFSITGIWYFLERTDTGSISTIANTKLPTIERLKLDSIAVAQLSYTIDYDRAIRTAQLAIPGLHVKDILPPSKATSPLYLNGVTDVALVRDRANRVYLHPTSYEVIRVQNAKQLPIVTWLNDIADPLHFGYFGGLATKLIWFVGGLGISFLVASGIWISLKRQIKHVKRAKENKLGIWKWINFLFLFLMFGFMYYSLFTRYALSLKQFVYITGGWALLYGVTHYLFVNKMYKPKV